MAALQNKRAENSGFTPINKKEVEAERNDLVATTLKSRQAVANDSTITINSADGTHDETIGMALAQPQSPAEHVFSIFELTERILLCSLSPLDILRARQISRVVNEMVNNSKPVKRIIFLSPLEDLEGKPVQRERMKPSVKSGCFGGSVVRPPPMMRPARAAPPVNLKLVRPNPFIFAPFNLIKGYSQVDTLMLSKSFQDYVMNDKSEEYSTLNEMFVTNPPVTMVRIHIEPPKMFKKSRQPRVPHHARLAAQGCIQPQPRRIGSSIFDPCIANSGGLQFKDLVAGIRYNVKMANEIGEGNSILLSMATLPPRYEVADEATQEGEADGDDGGHKDSGGSSSEGESSDDDDLNTAAAIVRAGPMVL